MDQRNWLTACTRHSSAADCRYLILISRSLGHSRCCRRCSVPLLGDYAAAAAADDEVALKM